VLDLFTAWLFVVEDYFCGETLAVLDAEILPGSSGRFDFLFASFSDLFGSTSTLPGLSRFTSSWSYYTSRSASVYLIDSSELLMIGSLLPAVV